MRRQMTGKGSDEVELWNALLAGEKPRYAGERLGIPPNRVRYICEKWARKRIYEWGVVHDLGWPEPGAGSSPTGGNVEQGCRCPVGLPEGAVNELIALALAVTGESPCPVHTEPPHSGRDGSG